jgi:hypothetical protein
MSLADLGRRAVACKHWRFMDGMLTTCGLRVVDGGRDYVIGHRPGATRDGGGWYDGPSEGFLPDLTDPATLGCLLHLVRQAWPDEWHKHVVPMWNGRDGWAVGCIGSGHKLTLLATPDGRIVGLGNTEAEALVAALEAAP